ncbi:Iron-sulfur cluster insertion protein ErpA [bacterium HR29]|jgi:iron-sulfur cluster assembly protein|nr:Iron-sulfur cluster insertion protein ErpA [bacterium HR29]
MTIDPVLTLTERAAQRLRALAAAHDPPDCVLRISLEGEGAAARHAISFEAAPRPGDVVLAQHEVTLALDPASAAALRGVIIDYENGEAGGRFTARRRSSDGLA